MIQVAVGDRHPAGTRGRAAAAARACSEKPGAVSPSFRPGRAPRRVVLLRRASPCRDGPSRGGRVSRIYGRIDPATGRVSSYDERTVEAAESRPKVLSGVAAHEAYHAAVGLLHGLRVTEARADCPSPGIAGHVLFAPATELRDKALMLLAGNLADPDVPDWPPEWPSRFAEAGCDEHRLAELVDELDFDRRGWAALCDEAKNLVASPGIDDLASMIEQFLAKGHVLDEATLSSFHNAVCPPQPSSWPSSIRRRRRFSARRSPRPPTPPRRASSQHWLLSSTTSTRAGIGSCRVRSPRRWRRGGRPGTLCLSSGPTTGTRPTPTSGSPTRRT